MYENLLSPYNPSVLLLDIGKQCRLRSDTAYDAVSDHALHCFLTEWVIKIWKKGEISPTTPKIGNRLVLLIRIGKFIRLKWVKTSRSHPHPTFKKVLHCQKS